MGCEWCPRRINEAYESKTNRKEGVRTFEEVTLLDIELANVSTEPEEGNGGQ